MLTSSKKQRYPLLQSTKAAANLAGASDRDRWADKRREISWEAAFGFFSI